MNASIPQTELERALAEAKANEIYSSQLMRRFRDTLSNVSAGLEDEGDRIYFGSTNDADQLRAIIEEVEELEWDRILKSSQKRPDLYAQLRNLNTELRALRKSQKAIVAALTVARDTFNLIRRAIYADDMAVLAKQGATEATTALGVDPGRPIPKHGSGP